VGDEFLLLLSELKHAQDAGICASKILSALRALYRVDHHCLHITASIGVSTYPADGGDAEILIKNADTAMYQAKNNGRDKLSVFQKAYGYTPQNFSFVHKCHHQQYLAIAAR